MRITTALAPRLDRALTSGAPDDLDALVGLEPQDARDRALTLLAVHDLHTAPLPELGERARYQGHPAVAELKTRLEGQWLAELDAQWGGGDSLAPTGRSGPADLTADPQQVLKAMRVVASRNRVPAAYTWLAEQASWAEVVEFLALEGGPDGGFDDLVAVCQVGLSGSAKLELGKNYWDEMGKGDPDAVHTVLHERLVAALDLPTVPRTHLSLAALERAALGGLLATNRWLQPEMLGALGLLELQAGPRCRMVLKAFDRLGAPAAAYPFYVEHAEVDPVHGKDWVEKAIVPTAAQHPCWGPRIVKGAWWRSALNLRFFDDLHQQLVDQPDQAGVAA